MKSKQNINELVEHLSEFITKERNEKINRVLENRTRHLTVVLEDIYQPHNASAVLRSCECFGVQDVHIIENNNKFRINPDIVLGATKWLTINKYTKQKHNTEECLNKLKNQGYIIAATSLHEKSISLYDINVSVKTALVFGTEMYGISEKVKEMTDVFVKISMLGFTESFNISVAVALSMFHFTTKMREFDVLWQLSKKEKNELKLNWIKRHLKNFKNLT